MPDGYMTRHTSASGPGADQSPVRRDNPDGARTLEGTEQYPGNPQTATSATFSRPLCHPSMRTEASVSTAPADAPRSPSAQMLRCTIRSPLSALRPPLSALRSPLSALGALLTAVRGASRTIATTRAYPRPIIEELSIVGPVRKTTIRPCRYTGRGWGPAGWRARFASSRLPVRGGLGCLDRRLIRLGLQCPQ